MTPIDSLRGLAVWPLLVGIGLVSTFGACGDDAASGSGPSDANDSGIDGADGGDAKVDAINDEASSSLGARCESDTDCGQGLQCVGIETSLVNGMTVAKGLCSTSCSEDPSVCDHLGVPAFCGEVGNASTKAKYCLEKCSFGPKGQKTFDPTKCHGRPEVACDPHHTPTTDTCTQQSECGTNQYCNINVCDDIVPTCKPRCNSDADCGSGRYCVYAAGLCSTLPAVGAPIGATCTVANDTCVGGCLNTGFNQTCSAECTLGVAEACGWDGVGVAKAGCLGYWDAEAALGGAGAGDTGLCMQLCDCATDCLDSSNVCDRLGKSYQALYNRAGGCRPAAIAADPISCDAGAVDGGSDSGMDAAVD